LHARKVEEMLCVFLPPFSDLLVPVSLVHTWLNIDMVTPGIGRRQMCTVLPVFAGLCTILRPLCFTAGCIMWAQDCEASHTSVLPPVQYWPVSKQQGVEPMTS
jgi:hypothetical protein